MSLIFGNRLKGPYYDSDWDEPYVRFECDHVSEDREIVIRLYRRVRSGAGVGLCEECAKKKSAEERKKNAEEAIVKSVAFAMEEGLRPLTGTRAQVEWAERLRADFFHALEKEESAVHLPFYTAQEKEEALEVLEAVRSEIKEQTEARWWIDSPRRENPQHHLIELCADALVRLRDTETRARFSPVTCGHPGPMQPMGARQKMFCVSCQEQITQRLLGRGHIEMLSVGQHVKAGLTPLEGSEKQVSWAQKIRDNFFHELMRIEKEDGVIVRRVAREALRQTKAKWWIDQANRDKPAQLYSDLKKLLQQGTALPLKTGPQSQEGALPLLQGTEKQVAWAEKIRRGFFTALSAHESACSSEESKARAATIRADMTAHVEARWWIGSPSRDNPAAHLASLVTPPEK
jgi:hypothetical protein